MDVAGGQVDLGQFVRVDPGTHGQRSAAEHVHPLDARQGGQLRLQFPAEKVGELGDGPFGGREAEVEGGVRPVGPLNLDDRGQGLLGELGPHLLEQFIRVPGHPEVEYISNEEVVDGKRIIPGETFHTDHSNHPRPPKATTLFAVELPSSGGDTQYVNMHHAYEDLPEDTKRRIDGLKAVHVYVSKYSPRPLGKITEESRRNLPPPGIHPLVRTHPENGRKALYLNPVRIESIVGMEDKDALALIEDLMHHATQKKYEYRHKWRHGDWVLWDNRSLLHQANPDYDMSERRYLYRLMLQGEAPV